MIDLSYPNILNNFSQHLSPKRSESASFLIWYLENYYRLDENEAVDSVCDQRFDKGVDGIFVNDNDSTITIFQAKILQKATKTIGDVLLKEFAGTLRQFQSPESIQNLINSKTNGSQLAQLITRLDIISKIGTHKITGEFISNVGIDSAGLEYIDKHASEINFVGKSKLLSTYISPEREIKKQGSISFDLTGFSVAEYMADSTASACIEPIKARELVKLEGIPDQSIYDFNVRGPLGKTQVNKDIVHSIKDKSLHKRFPFFHNGITIICDKFILTKDKIKVDQCWVVNGCQSLTALYNNTDSITDDLRVLTKFIRTKRDSDLAKQVTKYSNNQNGVKTRDFMANKPAQIRLQNEFEKNYKGQYHFDIKRGEIPDTKESVAISNETAGLLLMAFDLKEPWATHRKYQVFEDKYSDLFSKPDSTADKIVLCQVIFEVIGENCPKIQNSLLSKYILTKYFLVYCLRLALESDSLWGQIQSRPEDFVRTSKSREKFKKCISDIVQDLITDLNLETKDLDDDFDYRAKLRDLAWVKATGKQIVGTYTKLVSRKTIISFGDAWQGKPRS